MASDEDVRSVRDIELLYEIGTLRRVARAWVQFGGDQKLANVAEHTLRVAWLALILAKREGADLGTVTQLALVHDMAETRTGDVNYVSRMYVDRHEAAAVRDSVGSSSIEHEALDLWEEYQAQESLEAQVVKDADILDCDLELMESTARGPELKTALAETRERVYGSLRTVSAREMFATIYRTDPHDWHRRTRNRLTAGDWNEIAVTKAPRVSG